MKFDHDFEFFSAILGCYLQQSLNTQNYSPGDWWNDIARAAREMSPIMGMRMEKRTNSEDFLWLIKGRRQFYESMNLFEKYVLCLFSLFNFSVRVGDFVIVKLLE